MKEILLIVLLSISSWGLTVDRKSKLERQREEMKIEKVSKKERKKERKKEGKGNKGGRNRRVK